MARFMYCLMWVLCFLHILFKSKSMTRWLSHSLCLSSFIGAQFELFVLRLLSSLSVSQWLIAADIERPEVEMGSLYILINKNSALVRPVDLIYGYVRCVVDILKEILPCIDCVGCAFSYFVRHKETYWIDGTPGDDLWKCSIFNEKEKQIWIRGQ